MTTPHTPPGAYRYKGTVTRDVTRDQEPITDAAEVAKALRDVLKVIVAPVHLEPINAALGQWMIPLSPHQAKELFLSSGGYLFKASDDYEIEVER